MVRTWRFACYLLVPLAALACGEPDSAAPPAETADRLSLDFDRSDPERLIRYYFGSYVRPEAADPFAAGLTGREGSSFWVNLSAFEAQAGSAAAGALRRAATHSEPAALDWDEMKAFVAETYYDARAWPATLGELLGEEGWSAGDTAWFRVDATGSMTTARRQVYVRKSALRAALRGHEAEGERLMYPEGTVFIGEHRGAAGELDEATVMRKRSDGFWDYATYGPEGSLAAATLEAPRALETPTQCVGCHFGDRAFEPEKSFPREARDGPHGPRAIHVDDELRDLVASAELVPRFREHARRSDTILGLYNTLFVASLLRDRDAGTLSPSDQRLLERLAL
jgi:hypothetical protein